ncbi:MAG: hypothetical protein H7Z11_16220 [Verrucomicrobia bacterium]|nr:hypothetical protein [Leptolyngbya sp. ES-bin-22]
MNDDRSTALLHSHTAKSAPWLPATDDRAEHKVSADYTTSQELPPSNQVIFG